MTLREKKRSTILRSRFLQDIGKIWISSTKSWKMVSFRCNTTENFIFWFKYRQPKVDLNTKKKWLVFVTIQHRKFHLYAKLSYTKISYFAAFLHFRLKGSLENMIFPWNGNIWKLTKVSFFLPCLQIFVRQAFFCSCNM